MVSDILRAEREKQNLTIKDIEKGTSIRGIYIEAIENGEFNKLPGEVYAKGFIRNYATFLKLDADSIILSYTQENHPEEIAKAEAAKAAEEKNKEREKKAEAVAPKPQPAEKKTELRQQVESSHKKQNFMLIVAIILAVIGGAFYLTSGSSEEQPAAAPAPVETKAEEVPAKPAVPEKKADGVELIAKFTDRCWTQVDVDGKTIFEGIVEKGKTETWKGKEKVVITAGNAGAVELKLNGKELGKLGNTGEVVEKAYDPNGESTKQAK